MTSNTKPARRHRLLDSLLASIVAPARDGALRLTLLGEVHSHQFTPTTLQSHAMAVLEAPILPSTFGGPPSLKAERHVWLIEQLMPSKSG
jgi:hypothetical protein